MPKMDQIPHDDAHRFLKWQMTRGDCFYWAERFKERGVLYQIAQGKAGMWTIYKHLWVPDPNRPYAGNYCCGAMG